MAARFPRGLAAALAALAFGCDPPAPAGTARPGEPFPDLSEAQVREFEGGRALFTRVFTPDDGLGPTFNEASCVFCHDLPVPGGSGADAVRKASRFAAGECDLLREHGGDMLQTRITAALRDLGYEPEAVPRHATAVAMIMPPALFGAGLIEAIPEAAILERADPDDRDGDGISGRPGHAMDGRVGRFGWKASFATLRDFVESALIGEMGLTTSGFPREESIGPRAVPAEADPTPDPEVAGDLVDRLVAYVSMLAPPDPDSLALTPDSAEAALHIFERLGCAGCHTPEQTTGASDVGALDRRRARVYTDLLLHDMGPENASICAPGAGPAEWRTPPLIGLRYRHGFMHDGRASSVESAVRAHGGEAARARDGFIVLADPERTLLLHFLGSL